ncbi:MAG: acyltransferase [Nostocoides sp.]
MGTKREGAAHPDHKDRPNIGALTGLRSLAAVWVVLFHFRGDLIALAPWLAPANRFMAAGYLGVDLFFPLSGFVLAYNYADSMRHWSTRDAIGFLRNRVARVWPVHVVTLHIDLAMAVTAGAMGIGEGGHRRTLAAYVENLFMVHYWRNDRPSFNAPAWSISAEFLAYLAAPVIFLLLSRVVRARSALLGAFLSYAAMLVIFATVALPNGNLEHLPWVRIGGEFLGGVFLCLAWLRGRWAMGRVAGPLALVIVLVVAIVPAATGGHYWMALPLGLVVGTLAPATGWLARWLATRSMVLAGEASYCLYMTHWLLRDVVGWLSDWGDDAWWRAVLALGATVLVLAGAAWLLHVLVERPARRLLRTPPGRAAVSPARLGSTGFARRTS